MKSVHPTPSESNRGRKPKNERQPQRSRSLKSNFPIFKDGVFNCEPAPWGFNWLLGYCEQPQTFSRD